MDTRAELTGESSVPHCYQKQASRARDREDAEMIYFPEVIDDQESAGPRGT